MQSAMEVRKVMVAFVALLWRCCGVVVATDAVSGYEMASVEQTKAIREITDSCAVNFSIIFDKFEKVE